MEDVGGTVGKQGTGKRSTFFARPDKVIEHRHGGAAHADLHVCTVVFNPVRFRSRLKLYEDFRYMVEHSGATLWTCEIAQHAREFVVTEPDNPHHLQLVTESELWQKERALNLLIQRLPITAQYVATIDADVSFARPDWANETVQQLQHHPIVQLWTEAEDLGPDYEVIAKHKSFASMWLAGAVQPPLTEPEGVTYYTKAKPGKPAGIPVHLWHPGYAQAYRREALDQLGGLIDWGALGAGDYHMMWALIGVAEPRLSVGISPRYRYMIQRWQDRAERYIKRDLGVVKGKLLHYWHGSKASRQYMTRWEILVKMQFDPDGDLKNDWQGLHQLVVETKRQEEFRDAVRAYFRGRDEDSVNV